MTLLGHDGCEACAPEIARLRAECRRLREDAAAWERRASNLAAYLVPLEVERLTRERDSRASHATTARAILEPRGLYPGEPSLAAEVAAALDAAEAQGYARGAAATRMAAAQAIRALPLPAYQPEPETTAAKETTK